MIIVLSYIFFFVAATLAPLQRRWLATNGGSDEGQIHFSFQVILIIAVLGLLLPLFSPFYLGGDIFKIIGLTVICGLSGAIFFVSSFKAQKHVEAGVSTLLNNMYTPITIVLASLLLSERLTTIQIFGTALLFVGILVVSNKHRIGRFKFDKYFLLMLLSGIFMGILLTAERALQIETGFTAGTLFAWWGQCIFLGIAVLFTSSRCKYSKKATAVTGGLMFLQGLSWLILIFVVGNLSVASAVTTFKVVLVFLAAALFLKERDDLGRKMVGSTVALLGLLLMK